VATAVVQLLLTARCWTARLPCRHRKNADDPTPDAGDSDDGGGDLTAAAALRSIRFSGWLPPLLSLALVMNLLVMGQFFVMLPWRVTSQHLPAVTLGLAVSAQADAALATSLVLGRWPSHQGAPDLGPPDPPGAPRAPPDPPGRANRRANNSVPFSAADSNNAEAE